MIKEVDEKWDEIADSYDLDDEDFTPVTVTIYEHFYRNEARIMTTTERGCDCKDI